MLLTCIFFVVLALTTWCLYRQERRARKERKRLALAKIQFMQNAQHEMRTPLALIVAYAAMLADTTGEFTLGPLNVEQEKAVGVIHRRAQILHMIVNDMLTIMELSEKESPEQALQVEEFNLFDILSPAFEDFDCLCNTKGLDFATTIPQNVMLVGDKKYVLRAVENIVRNAIKFTDTGSVTVQTVVQDNDVVVCIADTGIGIPEDQMDIIFNRFCQVNGSMTRRYGGSGLGLSVAKDIVQAHGGHIEVASKVGVGSIFCLHFPVDTRSATL